MRSENKDTITNILKIVSLLIFLIWCFLIIQPFILVILWAMILAIALLPLYDKAINKLGPSKKKLGTVLFTLLLSILFVVPSYFITKSVASTTSSIIVDIKNNSLKIPAPNEGVEDWPLIGENIYKNWSAASDNIQDYAVVHKDIILNQSANLLSGFKGFVATFISFFIAFLLAVIFMYKSEYMSKSVLKFANKLIGSNGEELVIMSRDVIKSVVKGILLVAIIQSGLAFIGFKAIGLPAAGIFTFIILVTAIIQIPALLTMIPVIIIAFSISDTTPAIIFSIYCIVVGLLDNFLKPMLLGKGLQTPMIVILIGTIGGMLLHGIIGLFLGAIVLAVMYRIYQYWVNSTYADNL